MRDDRIIIHTLIHNFIQISAATPCCGRDACMELWVVTVRSRREEGAGFGRKPSGVVAFAFLVCRQGRERGRGDSLSGNMMVSCAVEQPSTSSPVRGEYLVASAYVTHAGAAAADDRRVPPLLSVPLPRLPLIFYFLGFFFEKFFTFSPFWNLNSYLDPVVRRQDSWLRGYTARRPRSWLRVGYSRTTWHPTWRWRGW